MYKFEGYLRTLDNETERKFTKVKTVEENGVRAVYINGFSQKYLNPEFGAGIDFEIDGMVSFMADYRDIEWWCRPTFGNKEGEIPDETQGLIYKKENGEFGVIMPVVSEKYKCVLCGKDDNTVTARIFSLYSEMTVCNALAFVYAEGDDPYEMLEKCTKTALKLLNNGCRTRKERRYPEMFEYLGWCSWDAFQIRVTEEDLLKKCEEFKKKDIPVKWAIIDDMWGEVRDFYGMEYSSKPEMVELMHSSKLYDFKADPIRFPNGLKGCIAKIKDYGMSVGVWHPTTGYWMGIDPEGDLYKNCKDYMIKTSDGKYIHDYKQENAYMFYNYLHDYLYECGTDFVKIDNQSICRRFFRELAPIGETARAYHKAMEASVGQHFDNCMINCMGMASEDMWNRPVSPISRCSNDFEPENSAWFVNHMMQCSYNDLIQGQLYYCDWDMWWTDDKQSNKNSLLRAISGGPIYISDTLDRSRAEVLKPLVLEDGRILRCDRPAMPTIECLTENPTETGKIFKLQNVCGDSGVIAAFNINADKKAATGKISPSDVNEFKEGKFAVYEHFSKELVILDYNEYIDLTLKDIDDFRLYIIVPMKNGFAPIGRIDKFISPKTIKSVRDGKIELIENGEYAFVENNELVIKKA